jgi:hypothetical protein
MISSDIPEKLNSFEVGQRPLGSRLGGLLCRLFHRRRQYFDGSRYWQWISGEAIYCRRCDARRDVPRRMRVP